MNIQGQLGKNGLLVFQLKLKSQGALELVYLDTHSLVTVGAEILRGGALADTNSILGAFAIAWSLSRNHVRAQKQSCRGRAQIAHHH